MQETNVPKSIAISCCIEVVHQLLVQIILYLKWTDPIAVIEDADGYFFIPNYPSDIATVNFDRSGTTVIGKYLLNHSFMMPGLVCVTVSTIVAYIITSIVF